MSFPALLLTAVGDLSFLPTLSWVRRDLLDRVIPLGSETTGQGFHIIIGNSSDHIIRNLVVICRIEATGQRFDIIDLDTMIISCWHISRTRLIIMWRPGLSR